jgi:hypothetical protein
MENNKTETEIIILRFLAVLAVIISLVEIYQLFFNKVNF